MSPVMSPVCFWAVKNELNSDLWVWVKGGGASASSPTATGLPPVGQNDAPLNAQTGQWRQNKFEIKNSKFVFKKKSQHFWETHQNFKSIFGGKKMKKKLDKKFNWWKETRIWRWSENFWD